ncbi:predicted protein [Phaeodactylum tricornutum CCAP 1055/1]|jgi:VIT1/CCC1 family predicted Fe2+/Mn2+ transporter|uniref:Uncharacterized protein n=2 Tax=Phaeodactylum tricornutum TaxID=2850 RepID=B7FRU5_PHATC|nr:predicted protein [Phaeodactylum tricornutum CCAP 1055/1]EEC50371.1 predicted protein [Phaeodactylum tricornutum CCAP 1055/1]|eukprot:XP_002177557.1 predicted protein [Phaeodactylum tricornutum CCAP 1055/1]
MNAPVDPAQSPATDQTEKDMESGPVLKESMGDEPPLAYVDTSIEKGKLKIRNDSDATTASDPTKTTVVATPLTSSDELADHLGGSRQYWRDIILGVNDGLVSTFLLVAGVAGGGLASTDILLTAIAGALAGAISMCAGEYVATKSQNQVLQGEINLEKQHVQFRFEEEIAEMEAELLPIIGIGEDQPELREKLLEYYTAHPDALLKIMIALEFGVVDHEQRSAVCAGLTSCGTFLLGTLPSVLPFVFLDDPTVGLIVAAIVATLTLLLVGAIKTWATRGNAWTAALENLVIAGVGGGFAYGIGLLFDSTLHG